MARDNTFVPGQPPTPEQIHATRATLGLNQTEAARSVYLGDQKRWSEYENGLHTMDAARWELFLVKHGLHPHYRKA